MTAEDLDAVADVIAESIRGALAPLLARLDAIDVALEDAGDTDKALGTIRERMAVVETKADRPPAPLDVTPVLARLAQELRGEFAGVVGGVMQDVVSLRERAAVLETRAPVPGPAGEHGTHGTNGKDGADGLGVEDLAVTFDGDRTLAFRIGAGDRAKVYPIVLPYLRYVGVFQQGKTYDEGDVVTWGGSTWHCARRATDTKPGTGDGAWTLIVKAGTPGRDGKDGAPAPIPVVKVGS